MSSEYIEIFIDESSEHLQIINEQLLELEKNTNNLEIVGEIFRSAHTLKGMAATMGFEDLADLTHKMENVLDLIRKEELKVSSNVLDVIFESVDDLEKMISSIASGGDGKLDVSVTVGKLLKIEKGENYVEEQVSKESEISLTEITHDSTQQNVILEAVKQDFIPYEIKVVLAEDTALKAVRAYMVFEELKNDGEIINSIPDVDKIEEGNYDQSFIITYLSRLKATEIKKKIEDISEIAEVEITEVDISSFKKTEDKKEEKTSSEKDERPTNAKQEVNKTIRVNIDRLNVLMNLFEELVIDRGRLEQISRELNNGDLRETVERMTRVTSDLQEIVLNMRMMPIEQVFNRFPRMVRSLSKELKKKVKLEIQGAETELDRTIIDEIGDPLVHLIRNSLDHGIETPEERLKQGKSPEGTITLKAYHSGNHVFIEIVDDGAGINQQKILQKAIKSGVVTEEESASLSDQQINNLLFAAGFSTAEQVTDLSGRGVGLDVVKKTFESLGGVITIDSTLGKGTVFSIQLPLTLSIIDVMLVEVQDEKYAIPLNSIIETAIVHKDSVYSAHNRKVIDFRGKIVPLVFLEEVFEVPKARENNDYLSIVIIHKGTKIAGLVVDSLIGQHDIVLKSLGNYLTNIPAISGATILGDGQVALIVDNNALIK